MLKLLKVAEQIETHLRRFASDPNLRRDGAYRDAQGRWQKGRSLFKPEVHLGENGNWVTIYYTAFRDGGRRMTPQRAREYLAWLDAGNVGPHWIFDLKTGGVSEPRGRAHNAHPGGSETGTPSPVTQDVV